MQNSGKNSDRYTSYKHSHKQKTYKKNTTLWVLIVSSIQMLFTPKHSFILDHCIRLKGVIEQWFPTQPPDLRDKTEKKEIFLFHKIMYELEGSLLTLEIAIFHKKKKAKIWENSRKKSESSEQNNYYHKVHLLGCFFANLSVPK